MIKNEVNENKAKLVRYLYPTKDIGGLMCNDIYQELLELIPLEACVSEDNLDEGIRQKNLEFVYNSITGFILGNLEYQKVLFDYYKHNNIDWITKDLLTGLVLYISTLNIDFKDIDILKNKQSILYNETFILDLIS